jgi:hypothetical protein
MYRRTARAPRPRLQPVRPDRLRAAAGQPRFSDLVQRAAHPAPVAVEHMGVGHRRRGLAVAQQLPQGADVVAGLQHVGGERVAHHVRRAGRRDRRPPGSERDRLLHRAFAQVVMAHGRGAGIDGAMRAREHPLPSPGLGGLGILEVQRAGQPHAAEPLCQIAPMQGASWRVAAEAPGSGSLATPSRGPCRAYRRTPRSPGGGTPRP